MTEIKLYKSYWKAVKLLILATPFVVIGIWAIKTEPFGTFDFYMGWFALCFFGMGIPLGLFNLFDRRPQIIINEIGIWDRTLKQDVIEWHYIKKCSVIDIFGQKFIPLNLVDNFTFNNKQYKWVSKLNKAVSAEKLNISLGQINVNEKLLSDFINRICKAEEYERIEILKKLKLEIEKK